MVDLYKDSSEIKETDIIFDCPHCAKSLAIDYRGAGLTIPCTDCGQYVDVPIPEGMELTDIDSSNEEQEVRILNLRRSLGASEARIGVLEARIKQLEAIKQNPPPGSGGLPREQFDDILKRVSESRRLLDEIIVALEKIGGGTQAEAGEQKAK